MEENANEAGFTIKSSSSNNTSNKKKKLSKAAKQFSSGKKIKL